LDYGRGGAVYSIATASVAFVVSDEWGPGDCETTRRSTAPAALAAPTDKTITW